MNLEKEQSAQIAQTEMPMEKPTVAEAKKKRGLPLAYWLIAILFCIVGLLLLLLGMFQNSGNKDKTSFSESFTEIRYFNITLSQSNLILHSSKDADTCTVELTDVLKGTKVYAENGTLYIEEKQDFFQIVGIRLGNLTQTGEVHLTVPDTYYETATLKLGFANANEIKGISLTRLELEAGVGNIRMEEVEVHKAMAISGGTGNLELKDVDVIGNNIIELGVGEFTAKDCDFYNLKLNGGTGNAELHDVKIETELDVDLGVGECNLEECKVLGKMDMVCGTGDCDIKDCEIADTELDCGAGDVLIEKTKLKGNMDINQGMGDIEIVLVGNAEDYALETDVGIGDMDIEGITVGSNSKAKYMISLEGGVGDISISVKEK